VVVGDTVTAGPEFMSVTDREDYETGRKPAGFFLERARRFFPGLMLEDLELDFTGIMANLREGSDFIIMRDQKHPNCVQLVGIDSPGLTCSLAIARRVRGLLE
jgi:glycerol-3-phosphate dehydrogenase